MVQQDLHISAFAESALSKNIRDSEIQTLVYNALRFDLTGSDSHGEVIIYHKLNMAVVKRTNLPIPQYSLILEITINRKKKIHSYQKNRSNYYTGQRF